LNFSEKILAPNPSRRSQVCVCTCAHVCVRVRAKIP